MRVKLFLKEDNEDSSSQGLRPEERKSLNALRTYNRDKGLGQGFRGSTAGKAGPGKNGKQSVLLGAQPTSLLVMVPSYRTGVHSSMFL